MTNEEALNDIRFCKCEVNRDYFVAYLKHDTIPTIRRALEKQIPKKAMDYKCPTCGEVFCTELWEVDYCCSCGQRLKWRDEE